MYVIYLYIDMLDMLYMGVDYVIIIILLALSNRQIRLTS